MDNFKPALRVLLIAPMRA